MSAAEQVVATPVPAAGPPARVPRRSRGWGTAGRYLLLVLVAAIAVGPMLWELSTSLKGPLEDLFTPTPQFVPRDPTLANYRKVLDSIPIVSFATNSLLVAAMTVTGNIVGASLAGYALAKVPFRGRRLVVGLFLSTLVMPGEATLVSQYVLINKINLGGTLLGVALPGLIGALNVLLLRNAFQAIPPELDEAAMIDGANVFQRYLRVGLPNVKGTLSIVAILTFIGAWDDFLWPLLVLTDPNKLTLTVGLAYLNSSSFGTDPRTVAAGAMIALIPVLIVFASLQRYFFRGVGEGAIKG